MNLTVKYFMLKLFNHSYFSQFYWTYYENKRGFERIPRSKKKNESTKSKKKNEKSDKAKADKSDSKEIDTKTKITADSTKEPELEPEATPEEAAPALVTTKPASPVPEKTEAESKPTATEPPELEPEPEAELTETIADEPELVETKPTPSEPSEAKSVAAEPDEAEATEAVSTETESADAKAADTKATEVVSTEAVSAEVDTAEEISSTDAPSPETIPTEEPKESSEELTTSPESTEITDIETEFTTPEPKDSEIASLDALEEERVLDETTELEESDGKKIDFDFFPTIDTLTIITHLDVDGLLCVAALNKMINSEDKKVDDAKELSKIRVFFTSPPKIFSTLAKSIPDLNKIDDEDFTIGQLYVCDLALNRDTLLGSTIYDRIKWFDHHEVNPSEQYDSEIDNLELILDPTANSATSIICDYFKIDSDFGKLADEIDANDVKSKLGVRLRDIVGALRLKHSGSKLKRMLFEFAQELSIDIKVIEDKKYDSMIEEYKKWLDDYKKKITENLQFHEINNLKIGILETENSVPIYSIKDNLKDHPNAPFDIIAVMIHNYYRLGKDKNNKYKSKRYTKVEFRTQTDKEIIELAKLLNGGGHRYASGATIHDGLEKEELLKTIESYYTPTIEKKE